ncbi:MAG: glycoside hydrolase [Actinobacteria bacterium]|nr:glycoside hydrolase [Actinomycetota bacterium]
MRAGPRSVRLLVVAAVAGAGALTATLAPSASAATGPKAVKGGSVEAWQAAYYRPPVAPKVPTATYYFAGGPNDDLGRLSSAPTSTFGRNKPAGGSDSSQTTNPAVKIAGDPGNAVWTAPFSGTIQGRITLDWWWATLDAASGLGGANATVNVIADPGTPAQKTIGSNGILISAFGSEPQQVTSVVDVKGVVAKTLKIQVIPTYIDASQDLRVYYGSATHPSSFAIPTKPLPPVKVPTTTRVKDTNPLVLSATPIGRKAAEPTIGITKEGNAFFAAATFDNVVGQARTKIFATYDGNKSWKDVSPQLAGNSFPPATLDPYLYVDQETGRIFSDDLTVGCSVLQWSDDQGKTWTRGNPLACELPVDDHQTLVAGNPPKGITTSGYPNVLYYCVNKIGTSQCARSTDGGNSFSVTGNPAFVAAQEPQDGGNGTPGFCGGLHGHIATDPAGRLYLPKGHCGNPWLAVSEDGGTTWRQTKVNRMNVAGIQTAVTTDKAGNVYYLWWDADTKLPYMAVSRDAGKTFGPALLVAPPGLRGVNFPSIDAGEKGHVVISYPGTMDPDTSKASRAWNYYVAVTDNALADRPVFHSATANPLSDPVHRGVCLGRCGGMLDFLDVVIAPSGALWATEVDTCTMACSSAKGPTLSKPEAPADWSA